MIKFELENLTLVGQKHVFKHSLFKTDQGIGKFATKNICGYGGDTLGRIVIKCVIYK